MKGRELADLLVRRPRTVLGVVLALTLVALVPALRLRLLTDLTALLPRDAPASRDYRTFLTTFGGFEKLFVIVEAKGGRPEDPGVLVDAAEQLATELAKSPLVANARYGLTAEDEAFFLRWVAPRAPLLLSGDTEQVRREMARRLDPAVLHERVGYLRQTLTSPAGSFAAPFFAADPLGFSEGFLAAAGSALPIDLATGAFLSRDKDAVLLMVTPARSELDPAGGRALLAALDQAYSAVTAVRRESGVAGIPLVFRAVGGPIYAAHDERIIREDMIRITFSSILTVGLLVLSGFEGLVMTAALFATVTVGLVWAAAATSLLLGSLTVVGIAFIATLLGMGIDYGIHGGARFRLLLAGGESRAAAILGALRQTGPAILAATLTTAVTLSALGLAHFRPLREMGQVLALGILSILAATAIFLPALLAAFPKASRYGGTVLLRRFWTPLFRTLVGFTRRRPRLVLGATLVLSLVAAAGLPRLSLNPDLRTLRPEDPEATTAERMLFEKFGLGLDTTTVVLRDRDLESALSDAARVRQILEKALGQGADITSPADWMVSAAQKTARLAALRSLPFAAAADHLEKELQTAGFRLDRFAGALAALRAFGRGEDPGTPPPGAWPSAMTELVRAVPGPQGETAVAVHVRAPAGRWAAEPPPEVLRALSAAAPEVAIASTPRVGAELQAVGLSDMLRSSVLAALLLAVVVAIAFRRRPIEALLAALPLALGCLWVFGLWGLAGRSIDLLCIATLPVLLGNGIDLGVYAVYGALGDTSGTMGGIAGSVERSGVALSLAALTTTAGFGSLGSSRIPGLGNAGLIVALGVFFCLVATVFVLPALEALRAGRPGRGEAA
ncbi:MAG TPA: MMPL family transporter [Thermoanaerobaculia bacterium]|nr:MMPL family transporter [Thermoanaerobaculia bacterium]